MCISNYKNETKTIVNKKKTELDSNNLPVGFLQNDIDEVEKKLNLPNNHKISMKFIPQRVATGKHHGPYGQGKGLTDHFLKIEDEVCKLIIAM